MKTVRISRVSMGIRCWFVILMMLSPMFLASAEPENSVFVESYSDSTFSIGVVDVNVEKASSSGDEWFTQMYYPSENGSGPGAAINSTFSPFPILIFFVDDGEDIDIYSWISELASAGYFVAIAPDEWDNGEHETLVSDISVLIAALAEININGTEDGSGPANMVGAFDIEHWGVSGHGTGGMDAALVYTMWENHAAHLDIAPPRSMFALGIDSSDVDVNVLKDAEPADPGLALFLTGTADQIAPASDHLDKVVEVWPSGWHRMSPLGANHIQYQDEQGILESLQDGSGNMDEEEQQVHAYSHLLSYLDLILKGDHSSWYGATNRDIDSESISDEDAYVDEDLNNSMMLKVVSTSGPTEEIELNQTLELMMNVSHRNGSLIGEGVYDAWCLHWNGSLIPGVFNGSTDSASCSVDSDSLAPGEQSIVLFASWDGMISTHEFSVNRGNTPLELISPTPVIVFNQHSSITIEPYDFAWDPDGQDLIFAGAYLAGEESGNLSLTNNGANLTIAHTGEPEWDGSVALEVWVSEQSEQPDSVNISTVLTLLPVDDPVVNTGPIPQQKFDEDSDGIYLDISQWFFDPENGTLEAFSSLNDANISADWNNGSLHLSAVENWSGAAILNLTVSDGSTPGVSVQFPIVVNALPDSPVFTYGALDFDEDDSRQIPLDSIAFDSDGDVLEILVNQSNCNDTSAVTALIQGDFLVLSAQENWHGEDSCWVLSVSDGVSSISATLNLSVASIDDTPAVSWHEPEVRGDGNISLGFTLFDEDEPAEHSVKVAWRTDDWLSVGSSACLDWTDGALACTVLLQPLFSSHGDHVFWMKVEAQGVSTSEQQLSFTISDVPQDDSSAEVEEVVSMFDDVKLRIAAAAIVFIIIVAFLGNLRRSTTTMIVEQVHVERLSDEVALNDEVIEVVEEESKPSGLLDLARRKG